MKKSRREFLKQVVYKAPVVIALGTLVAPISASAASNIQTPPPPGEGSGGLPNAGLG